MAQKLTHWLLITLVLSLGFGQLLRFDIFGLPLYLHDLLVLAIILINFYKVPYLVVPNSLKLFLFAALLSSIRALTLYPISLLLVPSLYLLRLLAYLLVYLLIKQSSLSVPRQAFLLSAFVSLAIGLVQYFLLPDMRVFQYLGWDDHLSRLTLPHFDPTFSAAMLSLAALSFPNYSPLFLIGILLTYARSIWLSLVVAASTFIRPSKLFLLIPLFLLFIVFLPKRFGEGTNLLRTFSISSRLSSDISYLSKYKWDLLLGRGLNTLVLDRQVSKYADHATGPNNSYLYLVITAGILGLVGWGRFMYFLYARSAHKSVFVFFFTASLFNNLMFYPFALLWILLIDFMVPSEA